MQFAGNTDADSLAIFCTTSAACMCEAPMMVLIRVSVNKMEFSCAAVTVGGFGRGEVWISWRTRRRLKSMTFLRTSVRTEPSERTKPTFIVKTRLSGISRSPYAPLWRSYASNIQFVAESGESVDLVEARIIATSWRLRA
jgi:hypothetical protein